MNKDFNHTQNDERYLIIKDWYNNNFARVQKWFYELIFYKKCTFTVTINNRHGGEELLYQTCYANKFNCGPRRKLKLLARYGHNTVQIKFMNGTIISLPVDRILNIYGWQYLLTNAEHIIREDTGEIVFYRM